MTADLDRGERPAGRWIAALLAAAGVLLAIGIGSAIAVSLSGVLAILVPTVVSTGAAICALVSGLQLRARPRRVMYQSERITLTVFAALLTTHLVATATISADLGRSAPGVEIAYLLVLTLWLPITGLGVAIGAQLAIGSLRAKYG